MRRLVLFVAVFCCFASAMGAAFATEYHVGSGQQYATVNALLSAVTPGANDIIWVHPGTYGSFTVSAGGGTSEDNATQIRAYDMNNKPIFSGGTNTIQFQPGPTKWWKIVGLEQKSSTSRGIFHVCGGLIIQDCYVHDNAKDGIMTGMCGVTDDANARLIAEYNELANNGSGTQYHSWYLEEYWCKIRYNWTHSVTGGIGYKDRSRDSLLEYNLIEPGPNGAGCAISFCGWDLESEYIGDVGATATMVGNVVTKNGGGNTWLFINNIRSADGGTPGYDNLGYLYLYNNSFYTENHTGPMLADDESSIMAAHNNIFHTTSCTNMWDQVEDASGPGQVLTSYNNWAKSTISRPGAFTNTVTGTAPGWVSTATSGGDFHLTSGSQCINAGRNNVSILPTKEYAHPCSYTTRPSDATIDIGAYEYSGAPQPPVANFTGNPTSGTAPLTVNFTDTSTNSPTSWSWNFGDSGTSTSQNPSHQYTSAGTYTVSLTATNSAGSDGETKTNYITVSAAGNPPVANFTGSPTSGTVPLTVNFTDTSTNSPTSWSWNFGDSSTSTSHNPSHQYTSAGTYTVSLRATNAYGYDDEVKSNYITVASAPQPPVANFSGSPTSGTAPLTVNFTDSSTNSPTSWSWNFGDSSTSTSQNPSHQYTSAGTYTVSLRATNAAGYDDESKTNYITVSSGGGPTTLFSDGFESNFDKWTDGGTTDWDRATSQKHSGSYSAHAGRSDNDLISDNINLTGYSSITIELWYRDDDIDDGDNIYLQLYDGNAYDNKFELGNSTEDTWNYYTTTINNSGGDAQYFISNFRIKFEGTSIDYGENLWIDDVLITGTTGGGPQPPVADFSGSPTSGTAPLTVNFTDSSTNTPTSWSWSFGDSSTSTSQNPSHQYTSAGTYTVSLRATNAGGYDDESKTNYITVTAAGNPPVANFSGSPTSGTAPLTVNFTDTSTNSPTSWSWNFGDSSSSTSQNPSHQYTSAGTYTVSLTATNAYGSDGETKTNYISVTSGGNPPVANFTGSPTSGTAPLTVNFTDTSTNSPTSWSWAFGDGGTSTSQDPSHQYTSAGTYTVSLTATNAYGSDGETKTNYISVTAGGGQVTIFSDDFSGGLGGWTVIGSTPNICDCAPQGLYSMVRFRYNNGMYRTISTVGYSSIVVSFDMTATGLDGDDNVQALWSANGSDWTVLKQINDGDPEEDWEFHYFEFNLPSGANNNPNFALKFVINNCDGYDENGRIDNVVVKGTS